MALCNSWLISWKEQILEHRRQTSKHRHHSNDLMDYKITLAVADSMVATLDRPLAAVNEVSQRWFMGKIACDIWVSFDVLCCTCSILHLVAISLDRYWAVTRVDYIHNRSGKRILAMVGISWALSAMISIPPLFIQKDEQRWIQLRSERDGRVRHQPGSRIHGLFHGGCVLPALHPHDDHLPEGLPRSEVAHPSQALPGSLRLQSRSGEHDGWRRIGSARLPYRGYVDDSGQQHWQQRRKWWGGNGGKQLDKRFCGRHAADIVRRSGKSRSTGQRDVNTDVIPVPTSAGQQIQPVPTVQRAEGRAR